MNERFLYPFLAITLSAVLIPAGYAMAEDIEASAEAQGQDANVEIDSGADGSVSVEASAGQERTKGVLTIVEPEARTFSLRGSTVVYTAPPAIDLVELEGRPVKLQLDDGGTVVSVDALAHGDTEIEVDEDFIGDDEIEIEQDDDFDVDLDGEVEMDID